MPRIPVEKVVEGAQTDIAKFQSDTQEMAANVKELFEADMLDHEGSKAFDSQASFENYWRRYRPYWYRLDVDRDGVFELIFSGPAIKSDEKEYFHLFVRQKGKWVNPYWEDGHFAGYQVHPRTAEIILIHHNYPCCYNASHQIVKVRLLAGKIHQNKKLLLANDQLMKGTFFPDKADFKRKTEQLQKETPLLWSNAIIPTDAYRPGESNLITVFPKFSRYRVLAQEGQWYYVEFLDAPPEKRYSKVINPDNLRNVHLVGWIQTI